MQTLWNTDQERHTHTHTKMVKKHTVSSVSDFVVVADPCSASLATNFTKVFVGSPTAGTSL